MAKSSCYCNCEKSTIRSLHNLCIAQSIDCVFIQNTLHNLCIVQSIDCHSIYEFIDCAIYRLAGFLERAEHMFVQLKVWCWTIHGLSRLSSMHPCFEQAIHGLPQSGLSKRLGRTRVNGLPSKSMDLYFVPGVQIHTFELNTLDATHHLSGVRTYSPHTPRAT